MRPASIVLLASVLMVGGCGSRSTAPAPAPGALVPAASTRAADPNATTVDFFVLPAPYRNPFTLAVGPDGAVWFGIFNDAELLFQKTPVQDGALGRLDANGTIATFDVPPAGSSPMVGSVTPDGRLWYGIGGNQNSAAPYAAGTITPAGLEAQYAIPGRRFPATRGVRYSTLGPDGNVWFAVWRLMSVARVTPEGQVSVFPLPPTTADYSRPNDIAAGTDGALWIVETSGDAIVRMTTDGTITNTYMRPAVDVPWTIAAGSDGNLWFTEYTTDGVTPGDIVRMTPSGQTTTFALPPSPQPFPVSIRRAADGFVFTDASSNAVGLIDYAGNVVELPFSLQPNGTGLQSAIQGLDGSYYFTDSDNNRIGRITLRKQGAIFPPAIALVAGSTQLAGVGVEGDRGPFTATVDDTTVATVAPVAGFPLNFLVTAVAPGTTTLEIKGKGKPMAASITVTQGTGLQSIRRTGRGRLLPSI